MSWMRRFIRFHKMRHPREMGAPEVTAFLSRLAADGVSASTQNQALSAILFLYEVVMGQRLPWMRDIVRAQRPVRLPVVLSRDEVACLLGQLRGTVWLMAALMYGSGLRLMECAELRVKDLHADRGELVVRDGKGCKDRVTMLPGTLRGPLAEHLARVKGQHDADLSAGLGAVALPGALRLKYPRGAVRVGVAVAVSRDADVRGLRDPGAPSPPPARVGRPAGGEGGRTRGRDHPAGHLPLAAALVRDAPARVRL